MTRVLATAATPFPVRLTTFIGRATELRDVHAALDRRRLVTLVGPGGAGKTRLAIEAAQASTVDQKWYADLAPVDGDGVEAALAAATGASEGPGEDPLLATVRRIDAARALLLVDNADLVLDACAQAVESLLRSCPGLVVLATSREPLRAEGEDVLRVPPLSLPSGTGDGDAVRLFLDRALLAPDFEVRDRATIDEICRRLDGMPLAIELAAARVGTLSVADIAAGLADRFRLLSNGPRTGDDRQRSLSASVEWSYRLLTETEAIALQRLSVFRSPFVADAASAVIAGGPIDPSEALPLLARLVEKSLVMIDERAETTRYRLLETIRDFAGERLASHPEDSVAARNRRLRYFCELAGQLEPVPWADVPKEFVTRLESELPDITDALAWAEQTGDVDDAFRLIWGLTRFWRDRGRAIDGRIIARAVAADGGTAAWRARAYLTATLAGLSRHDHRAAIGHGEQAIRWAVEADLAELAAMARCLLGWTYLLTDAKAARSELDEARRLAEDAGSPGILADTLTGLAMTRLGADLPAARVLAEQALTLAQQHSIRLEECHATAVLVWIAFHQGRLDELEAQGVRALAMAESLGDSLYQGSTLVMLAIGAMLHGDSAGARVHVDARTAMARASGNPAMVRFTESIAALLDTVDGRGADAPATLSRLVRAEDTYPMGMVAVWLCDVSTAVSLAAGEPLDASETAVRAAAYAEAADNDWGRSRADLAAARVEAHTGELQAARDLAHSALVRADHHDDAMTTVDGLELLARLESGRAEPALAVRLLAAAQATRRRIRYLHSFDGPAGDRLAEELRERLGEEFDQAWADGSELSLADAVALARRGRGRRGRPALGWEALTPAEQRVATLVGDGLTNPQIAARLFVSPDTVKGHVSAALRKLGVTNRAALAAEATRQTSDSWT
ncbi:LuxR C-terminal-related transcriptional regulator [Microlunatus sp. GCM10028923]|uniref:helix-turn-helix transcriptional regulator n=1 Tax=Microlunatus sp. GCM10028923 TaxID=3273400 RepID=UPI00362240A8